MAKQEFKLKSVILKSILLLKQRMNKLARPEARSYIGKLKEEKVLFSPKFHVASNKEPL